MSNILQTSKFERLCEKLSNMETTYGLHFHTTSTINGENTAIISRNRSHLDDRYSIHFTDNDGASHFFRANTEALAIRCAIDKVQANRYIIVSEEFTLTSQIGTTTSTSRQHREVETLFVTNDELYEDNEIL